MGCVSGGSRLPTPRLTGRGDTPPARRTRTRSGAAPAAVEPRRCPITPTGRPCSRRSRSASPDRTQPMQPIPRESLPQQGHDAHDVPRQRANLEQPTSPEKVDMAPVGTVRHTAQSPSRCRCHRAGRAPRADTVAIRSAFWLRRPPGPRRTRRDLTSDPGSRV